MSTWIVLSSFLDEHAEDQGYEMIFPSYFSNAVQC